MIKTEKTSLKRSRSLTLTPKILHSSAQLTNCSTLLCFLLNSTLKSYTQSFSLWYQRRNSVSIPISFIRSAVLSGFTGGGRGIRTPVGLHPNGFQDRPVMTASVSLRAILFTNTYYSDSSWKDKPLKIPKTGTSHRNAIVSSTSAPQ